MGTLAAALVTPGEGDGRPFIVASMYGAWEDAHVKAYRAPGTPVDNVAPCWFYGDASAQRVICDLSVFIGEKHKKKNRYPVPAAGDLNISFGHRDEASAHWTARYSSGFCKNGGPRPGLRWPAAPLWPPGKAETSVHPTREQERPHVLVGGWSA